MARPREFDEERTLEKAMELFWRKGYEATSIHDLTEHLGIGRRSLYNTFTNKRQLFLRSLEHYQSTVAIRPKLAAEGATSMKEAVGNILTFFVEDSLAPEDRRGCFIVNSAIELAPHDVAVCSKTGDTIEGLEAMFFQILSEGDPSELVSTQPHRILAQNLMNTVLGIRVLAKVRPDRATFDNVVQSAMTIFH